MTQEITQAPKKQENNAFDKIAPNLTNAAKTLNNYVIAPLQNLGVGGFKFDKIVSSNLKVIAKYTTNYVETGFAITDHSTFEPKRLTLTGYVGEKVYNTEADNNPLARLTQKLTVLNATVPKLTAGMQQIKNTQDNLQKKDVQNSINSTVDFYNTLKSIIPSSRKSGQAYAYLEALWRTGTVLSLTEPDGTYHSNMVILSIDKKTRENTLDMVDFAVELQEFRVAKTTFEKINPADYVSRASEENTETTVQSNVQGETSEETTTSLFKKIVKLATAIFSST